MSQLLQLLHHHHPPQKDIITLVTEPHVNLMTEEHTLYVHPPGKRELERKASWTPLCGTFKMEQTNIFHWHYKNKKRQQVIMQKMKSPLSWSHGDFELNKATR